MISLSPQRWAWACPWATERYAHTERRSSARIFLEHWHEDVRSKGRFRGRRDNLRVCANEESWKSKGERPMPLEHFIAMDTHSYTTDICVKTRANTPGRTWRVGTTIPELRKVIESVRRPRHVA